MKKTRILLIDDCEEVGYLVHVSLKPLLVDQVFNLAQARESLAQSTYDLLLIDAGLPDGDGFKFCQELTEHPQGRSIPKILLTARRSTSDKVFGLNCGADDYVTKPFDPPELKARIDAKLRHLESQLESLSKRGRFQFDVEFQRCVVQDDTGPRDLQLTPTEFRILFTLFRHEGSPLSRHDLVQHIWRAHGLNIEERGIDTHIRHLRKKLGSFSTVIVSVYGKGYAAKLEKEHEETPTVLSGG